MAALAQRDGVVQEKAPRRIASVVCKLLSTCPSTGASQVVVESIGGDMAQFFHLFLFGSVCIVKVTELELLLSRAMWAFVMISIGLVSCSKGLFRRLLLFDFSTTSRLLCNWAPHVENQKNSDTYITTFSTAKSFGWAGTRGPG